MRYFVTFSYFGTVYHGWQSQPNAQTVQQLMEEVFATLLRQNISLVAAGRTDAGVHAKKMIAHFDIATPIDTADAVMKLNSFLPDDIAIEQIFEVTEEAHARFSAVSRTYEYWIVQQKNPFYKDTAYYLRHPLDIAAMNAAAELLLKYEDFECFSKSRTDVKTYRCDISEANWVVDKEKLVFKITADRFLRNMVRAIVGTLLDVGQGKIGLQDVKTIIKSKDRGQAGASVPAKGLYLTQVEYPKNILKINE
ncbi:tRNA pseudouridine(38-40) synthase TruA [Muriicola sp. Z0-33]|uniref:tRNA pseudouridine(38-40) synthase TruA n=1 Tax=Muriicola sp. Z0-33 TaxID=2816957 RepID=UPI002238F747|nr:tRNA pseudouridine(38-40) synthase TruA [Muriicola sp. Z0-33]MCW5517848.1 tRNA pseudouridine(38-40) synthase TruA [Muriicola sp. Z0-33]